MTLILPDKYTDISSSLLRKTSTVISIFLKYQKIPLHELYQLVRNEYETFTDTDFVMCLDILYVFGKIKYDSQNDVIEFDK